MNQDDGMQTGSLSSLTLLALFCLVPLQAHSRSLDSWIQEVEQSWTKEESSNSALFQWYMRSINTICNNGRRDLMLGKGGAEKVFSTTGTLAIARKDFRAAAIDIVNYNKTREICPDAFSR